MPMLILRALALLLLVAAPALPAAATPIVPVSQTRSLSVTASLPGGSPVSRTFSARWRWA